MVITIYFILLISALSAPAYAVTDQEWSTLLRLNTELEVLSKNIEEAQKAVNPDDRKQISYQKIRADLQKIQQGILDAINAERREPRSLPPVDGDYR